MISYLKIKFHWWTCNYNRNGSGGYLCTPGLLRPRNPAEPYYTQGWLDE